MSERVLTAFGKTPDVIGTALESAGGILRRTLAGKEGAEIVAGRRSPAPGLEPLKGLPARSAWMMAEMMERPFAVLNFPAAVSDAFGTLVARQGAGKKVLTEGFISAIEAMTTGSSKFGELYFMTERFRKTQNFHGDIIAPLLRELSGSGKKEIRLSGLRESNGQQRGHRVSDQGGQPLCGYRLEDGGVVIQNKGWRKQRYIWGTL